jgi:DNA-binding CsgD family transcriptional regulator/Tfp pilus assembly protein PilF
MLVRSEWLRYVEAPYTFAGPTEEIGLNGAGGLAVVATGVLLERETELERLSNRIDSAFEGGGATLAVEGEAGIGKSALLAETVRLAGDRGMSVLRARGGQLEREFAYGLVRQLLEPPLARATARERELLLGGAARLATPALWLAEPGPPSSGDSGQAVLHGLYWLSANLANERPLLMAIDDAHWGDSSSLRFVSYLARRVHELAVLIIYAARPAEGASEALPDAVDHDLVAEVLRPAPLSEAATAELIARLRADSGSVEFARACHRATVGNPFLLRELLRALEDESFAAEDGAERIGRLAPQAIARAILARLRRLGADAAQLAFAVALLGASAELRHAAELAGLTTDAAATAADALASAWILRPGYPLEFVHPIVRSAVYSEIPAARRGMAHRRAAQLWEEDGAVPEAVAPHLLATNPAGDGWVVERLRAAAEAVLERGAPETACGYLERALAEPPHPEDRPAVLRELGSAELRAGRSEAIVHLRAALETARDDATRAAAVGEVGLALTAAGRVGEAMDVVAPVIAELARTDREAAMKLDAELAGAAHVGLATTHVARERLAQYKGRLRGVSPGERFLLASLAFQASFQGGPAEEAANLAELALADGRLLAEQRPDSHAFYQAVITLVFADRFDRAERMLDMAIADARSRGSMLGFAIASSTRSHALLRQGRIAEAEADGRAALEVAPRAWPVGMVAVVAYLIDAMTERTDLAACEALLEENGLIGDTPPMTVANPLLITRGQLRLAAGDARRALVDMEELLRRDERSKISNPAAWPAHGSAALAYALLGEREAARAHADKALAQARGWGTPSTVSFALRAAGVAEGGAAGIALLRESARVVETSPARYEHARSLAELGSALRRAGHRRDAREPLRHALDLAHRCGARRLAGSVHEELLAAGARPRRIALSGVDSLTGSEHRVAQLAAAGLANREIAQALFVTVRTVEMHLTHAYKKLDISSREELPPLLRSEAAGQ